MKIDCVLVRSGNSIDVYCKEADYEKNNKTLLEIGNNYDAYSENRKTQKRPFPVPMALPISDGKTPGFWGIVIDKNKLNDFKNDKIVNSLLKIVREISAKPPKKPVAIPVAQKEASLAEQLAELLK